jgi:hypothetical protein
MVVSGLLLGFAFFLIALAIVLAVVSFLFWLNMLTDALKKRDVLWISLLVAGFLSGVLSGLFSTLYYEIMYKDDNGHHKKDPIFILMVVSTIVFILVSIVFFVILFRESGNIFDTLFNAF